MAFKLFSTWTEQEVTEAIRNLESQLASGASSVSYTGGGSVSMISSMQAKKILKSLYGRLDDINGTARKSGVRHVKVIALKGY